MQESPQLRQERDLARRNWIGCLLTFAATAIILILDTALPSVSLEHNRNRGSGAATKFSNTRCQGWRPPQEDKRIKSV